MKSGINYARSNVFVTSSPWINDAFTGRLLYTPNPSVTHHTPQELQLAAVQGAHGC